MKRGTVSFEGMMAIAEVLGVGYKQVFVLPDGEKNDLCNIKKEF